MRLRALRIVGLRCIAEARLEVEGDLVVLRGRNGAGKSSVLEAIHLLGYGRSFRGGGVEALIRRGAGRLAVAAAVERGGGLLRAAWSWGHGVGEARLQGARCRQAELLRAFRVLTQHPESHVLVQGPREERRRFLDWLMFHVEPSFLAAWREFRRALRQRNAAIREMAEDRALAAWEPRLSASGEWIARCRRAWLERLSAPFAEIAGLLAPELSAPELVAVDGWPPGWGLQEFLVRRRSHDRLRGRTEAGPHRGGFELRWDGLGGERLSRGQAKLAALSLLLAAAELLRDSDGEMPILLLDDFAAELDRERQEAVVERLAASPAQVWITLTEVPESLRRWPRSASWFHVEQGAIALAASYNDGLS
jgi:DNA replication and repair protein RecF